MEGRMSGAVQALWLFAVISGPKAAEFYDGFMTTADSLDGWQAVGFEEV